MYILLLDGLLPKFVTWTSEAAFAGAAANVTAVRSPAAASVAAQAVSSALSHLFMLCPVPSLVVLIPSAPAGANGEHSEMFRNVLDQLSPLLHSWDRGISRGPRPLFASRNPAQLCLQRGYQAESGQPVNT